MRLDYRCNLPLLFPVLDSPPHQLPAVRRSIYPFCFPLYERYFFVKGNHTARPVECMPCTPAHASIDRIFFRHIANAANALVSPHYLFLISAILMLASAYFCVPVLILNYAFCIRSNEILVDGFSFPSGIVYALALSLLCMFIGRHRFRNFDLY